MKRRGKPAVIHAEALEPTRPDDLLSFRLGRRLIRHDARRLAVLADGLLTGTEHFTDRRVRALGEFGERLGEELAHQLDCEDALLWPLLARYLPAASTLDPGALARDTDEVRSLTGEVRRAVRAVVGALEQRPAVVATRDDHARMGVLAGRGSALVARLDTHAEVTEPALAEALTTAVPRTEWVRVLEGVSARRPDMVSVGARMLTVASASEAATIRHQFGARTVFALKARAVVERSRERALFREA